MDHEYFTKEKLELIMIQLILLGEVKHIKLFSSNLDEESKLSILNNLVCLRMPPIYVSTKQMPDPLNVRWTASRLLIKENVEVPDINFSLLANMEFQNMNDLETFKFKKSYSKIDNKPYDESNIIQFASSYLRFYTKKRSISDILLKYFSSYFIQVPFDVLFRNFQFRSFYLFTDFDEVPLNLIDTDFSNYSNYQPFEDLFQAYRGYEKDYCFQKIQSMFVNDVSYPDSITNDEQGRICSLINTSLCKRIHFIDILQRSSLLLFKEEKYQESIDQSNMFGFESWIFIANHYKTLKGKKSQESLEDTINFFRQIDINNFPIANYSNASDFLNRIQNDNHFLSMIRQNTGQNISRNEFLIHSFPFVLSIFLKSNEPLPFKDLSENPLFIINDDDRLNDLDFVWSYFALSVAISALTNPDEAEELIDRSCWYISQIHNPKIHHDIVVDLFSIMFLQNSSKKYICFQFVAEIILTNILDLSDDNPELLKKAQSGHMLIQFVRTITNGMDFEDLIFPKKEQLFQALEREDWMIADRIASISIELSNFNEIYKTVNDFLKKSKFLELLNSNSVDQIPSFDPKATKSTSATIEIGLSFPDQLNSLQESLNMNINPDEIKNLIENRCNMNNEYKNLIYPIKTLENDELIEINKNLTRLSSTTWTPFNISETNDEHLNLLNTFLVYLNTLITTISNEENNQIAIYDILNTDPTEFINKFYSKGSIKSAEKISKLIKRDMKLMILTDKAVSSDSIKQIENKTIALAAILGSENGLDVNPFDKSDSIAYRIANIALQSNAGRKSMIHRLFGEKVDESNLTDDLSELKKLFEDDSSQFDIEKVVDISYRLQESVFSEFLFNYVYTNSYFEKVTICVQNCGSISADLYDSVMILLKYQNKGAQIYPFTDLFKYMIINKQYFDASKFLRLFGHQIDDYFHIISDFYNETKEIELLSISPKDRSKFEINNQTSTKSETSIPIQYDFECIEKMINANPNLNLDDEIIQYIECNLENEKILKILNKSLTMIKNIDHVIQPILKILENIVSKINVDSNQSENLAWFKIHSVTKITITIENFYKFKSRQIHPILENFLKRLSIIQILVNQNPYHLLKCCYNLSQFGCNIDHVLSKIDRLDALLSFYQLFRNQTNEKIYENSTEIDSYIFNCCQFGITDFPFQIKTNSKHPNPGYSCHRSLFEKISILLTRDHFFEPQLIASFIETFPPIEKMLNFEFRLHRSSKSDLKVLKKTQSTEFSDENQSKDLLSSQSLPSLLNQTNSYHAFTEDETNEHFFRRIHVISAHGCRPVPNKKLMKNVFNFFISSAPADMVIEYFTEMQEFSTAMKILNRYPNSNDQEKTLTNINIGDETERKDLFQNSFFENVLGRGDNIMILLKKGLIIDSDLLELILSISGPLLRFELYSYQGDWNNAYHTAIELFCQSQEDDISSTARAMNLLNWMDNCLANLPDSDQKRLDIIHVTLQREICQFSIDKKIVCDYSALNIFQTDIQREQVVIFLLTHANFKFGIAILRFFSLNPCKIGERLCDILVSEDPEKHFQYLTQLQRELDIMIFSRIYYAVCARLAYVHEFPIEDLMPYIELVKDPEFKCKLLIEFDKFEEAANLAVCENKADVALLVVNKGYYFLKPATISKCMKIIMNSCK